MSVFLQEYTAQLEHRWVFQRPPDEVLRVYRIEFLTPEKLQRRCQMRDMRLVYMGYRASIATYLVQLGEFQLTLNLLSLPGKLHLQDHSSSVHKKDLSGTVFVTKVIPINSVEALEEAVIEVAFAKLCAMFGIGPNMQTRIPFDLILYEDAVKIHLELCQRVDARLKTVNNAYKEQLVKLNNDIRHCLRVLHGLHIIHKNIKPDKILWCERLKRYVLCDFHLAEYVNEDIGELSSTMAGGTPGFMGPEMQKLYKNRNCRDKIDLYYNDLYGVIQSLKNLPAEQTFEQILRCKSQQQLKTQEKEQHLEEMDPSQIQKKSQQCVHKYSFDNQINLLSSTEDKSSSGSQPRSEKLIDIKQSYEMPDSYAFYSLVYTSICLNQHVFNLKDNLPMLTPSQAQFIYAILKRSLNKAKMEAVLRELRALSKEQSSQWAHWLRDFQQAFADKFQHHRPREARIPLSDKKRLANLMRLLGKQKALRMVNRKFKEEMHSDNTQIIDVRYSLRLKKKFAKFNQLFLLLTEEITVWLRVYFMSSHQFISSVKAILKSCLSDYQSGEFVLQKLIEDAPSIDSPNTTPVWKCFLSICEKSCSAASLLQYIQSEPSIEKGVFAARSYWLKLNKADDTLLSVCQHLLEILDDLPRDCYYQEIVIVFNIQLQVKSALRELNHSEVREYFDICVELLELYGRHTDAQLIVSMLMKRLQFYQQFEFPLQDMLMAHIEFEQWSQFYSQMFYSQILPYKQLTDAIAMSTYIIQQEVNLQEGTLGSDLLISQVSAQRQMQQFIRQGQYRSAMQSLQRAKSLKTQQLKKMYSSDADGDTPLVLRQVELQTLIGRRESASRLLNSISHRVQHFNLSSTRHYYCAKATVDRAAGRYKQAEESILKTIPINDKFAPTKNQRLYAYGSQIDLASICSLFGRHAEALDHLQSVREMQTEDAEPNTYLLALNYSHTAETLRLMGKLEESHSYCQKVFDLEAQGRINPYITVLAHLVMARNSEQLGDRQQMLRHSWSVLEKTTTLGDECFCIAYTHILRHYLPLVGIEAYPLISYVRKETDPPNERLRGGEIAQEMYVEPPPSGRLPLDIPIADFIELYEDRLQHVLPEQHKHCIAFKAKLAEIMPSKFSEQPKLRIIYMRIKIEVCLHQLMAGMKKQACKVISDSIEEWRKLEVEDIHQPGKQQLIEFIVALFKSNSKIMHDNNAQSQILSKME